MELFNSISEFFLSTWWGIVLLIFICLLLWVLLSVTLYKVFFKRFYDFVLSFIALVVLSPIFLVLIVVGAIKMGGNPFFSQVRIGKKNKLFKMLKFRTMTNKVDSDGVLLPDSERLTKYGKFLRATSLDELPGIINIFLGCMSIVGPRPQLVVDLVFMNDEVRLRHDVRPGLTGYAQVNGRNSISVADKYAMDVEYVSKISLFNDLKICFQTALKVLKRSDIGEGGGDNIERYGYYLLVNDAITQAEYDEKIQESKEILDKFK